MIRSQMTDILCEQEYSQYSELLIFRADDEDEIMLLQKTIEEDLLRC